MGLDMYLYTNSKRVCQEVNDQTDEWEGNFQTPRGLAVQWRKANAVHKWFVDNVQYGKDDCGLYEVSVSQLVALHDTCKEVLDSTELIDAMIENGRHLTDNGWEPIMQRGQMLADPSKAQELLPTNEGFFFGGTDYDQWYWWDLQFTVEKLGKLLENLRPSDESAWHTVHKDEPDWYVKFYYSSSW